MSITDYSPPPPLPLPLLPPARAAMRSSACAANVTIWTHALARRLVTSADGTRLVAESPHGEGLGTLRRGSEIDR